MYGLSTIGTTPSITPSIEQSAISNSVTMTPSGALSKSSISPSLEGGLTQDTSATSENQLFHNTGLNSTADWDMFGKTAGGKLVLNATNQAGVAPSLPEWPIPGHQVWLLCFKLVEIVDKMLTPLSVHLKCCTFVCLTCNKCLSWSVSSLPLIFDN